MYSLAPKTEFMKRAALFLSGIVSMFLSGNVSAEQPRGTVLELHSCELYAGGCVVSSESTLGGRYMVRAWDFTGGEYAGTQMKGLKLAVLQTSSDNLAAEKSAAEQAVVYVPEGASDVQRKALLGWLRETALVEPDNGHTRRVALDFGKNGDAFAAGKFINIKTGSLESCETGACGETLWYTPRAETSHFTVAVNRGSKVSEPLLELKWQDGGKRSVFIGRFGDTTSKNVYVTRADLCGPTGQLF
jgi:hypothetical protein